MTGTHHLLLGLDGFTEPLHFCLMGHAVSVGHASVKGISLGWVGYFAK